MAPPISLDSKIVIVGAGIGGLALALVLARKGATNLRVLERRAEISELGAGLQLGVNATRLLNALSLGDALEKVSFRSDSGEMLEGLNGRKLADLPLDEYATETYGVHSYQLARADLVGLLWEGLKSQLGFDPVQYGCEVSAVSERGVVRLADGSEEQADLVIGADGVESRVRSFLSENSSAQYSGYYAWRGLLDLESAKLEQAPVRLSVWVDEGKHLIAYPLNQRLLNLVGVVEQSHWPHSSPVENCSPLDWLNDYSGWDSLPLSLVGALTDCQKWSLRLIPPLPAWGNGCVGLLGDAAHPMMPSLAQGAAQALEDAVFLGGLICRGDLRAEDLMHRYHAGRIARVEKVQAASFWNLRFFHRPAGMVRDIQNLGMRLGGGLTSKIIASKYHWLYREH